MTHSSFVGRRGLLSMLARHLDQVAATGHGRMLAVRGRRQVGKSTLLDRFASSSRVPAVFTTGRLGSPLGMQLAAADRALRASEPPLPGLEIVASTPARSWEEWLSRLAVPARSGPVVVILDEFPWLVAADPTLEGVLQVVWDRVLEKLPVLLVLVGSDVAMMDRLTDHDRALFGRARPLVVPPLDPADLCEALPGWSATQVIDAAVVTGGYPRLVSDLARRPGPGIAPYIREALRDPYSPLLTTARLTLDAEFPSPGDAARVLTAIGADDVANPGFNDILATLDDAREREAVKTATTRALRMLTEDKALVEREQPALAPPSGKLRRYRITDSYLRFWFRYAEPGLPLIERGRPDLALARFERDWPTWRGVAVEPLVRASLTRLAAVDARLDGADLVLPWWRRATRTAPDAEVDVVALAGRSPRVVGSIKWRDRGGLTTQEVAELRAHRDLIPGASGARLAAITPAGASTPGIDVTFGAADLIRAWQGAQASTVEE